MDGVLYLDTARLGQISVGARQALTDVMRFSQACGASTYFDDLLFGGHEQLRNPGDFLGLSSWKGVESLRAEFRQFVFGRDVGETVFASRTASLMAIAAKMLFSRCRNVLVTDLNWQPYLDVLSSAIPNDACKITCVPIKRLVFDELATATDLVDCLKNAYVQNGCDGLFLPAVCNRGVKLSIKMLLDELRESARVRFSILDAAQALNHIDLQDVAQAVDFTIAGTHKWLRAFEPMGVGFFSKQGSRGFIRSTITRQLAADCLSDPLLRFTESEGMASETVNLQPLFAASGALSDSLATQNKQSEFNACRSKIIEISRGTGWTPLIPHPELASRIVLTQKKQFSHWAVGTIRKFMMNSRVAVSDFGLGQCRISTPVRFSNFDEAWLRSAMASR